MPGAIVGFPFGAHSAAPVVGALISAPIVNSWLVYLWMKSGSK